MNEDQTSVELALHAARMISPEPDDALKTALTVLAEQVRVANTNTLKSPSRATVRRKLKDVRHHALVKQQKLKKVVIGGRSVITTESIDRLLADAIAEAA